MYKLLAVDPLEPLALSRRQITGLRYYQSSPATFPLPQPTTILGALGSILGLRLNNIDIDSLEDLEKTSITISDKLNCSKPLLKGPLLQVESSTKIYVPVNPNLYVASDLIGEVILRRDRPYYYIDKNICKFVENSCIEIDYITLTGVSLERAGIAESEESEKGKVNKVVKLGYMYKYPVVIYRDRAKGNIVKTKAIYLLNCRESFENTIVRTGGESRVAIVRVKDVDVERNIIDKIANPLENLDSGEYLAISYIPIITKDPCTLVLRRESVYGLEFVKNISDIIGMPQEKTVPKLVVERLGLGYSEAMKKRRPFINALPPGTIIRISGGKNKSIKLIEILWNIGYATLIKLQ